MCLNIDDSSSDSELSETEFHRALQDRTYTGRALYDDDTVPKSHLIDIINKERQLHMEEMKELEDRIKALVDYVKTTPTIGWNCPCGNYNRDKAWPGVDTCSECGKVYPVPGEDEESS